MRCEFCCRISTSAKKMGITFHNFPKDDIMKNAWIKSCVIRGCTLAKNMNTKTKRLCSNHFNLDDFEKDPSLIRRKLKRDAVPTRFSKKPFLYCIACSDIAIEYSDVNLHEFPEDSTLKKKWADICRQNDCDVKNIFPQYALCSNHFPTNCFIQNKGKKYLKHDAVPFIFAFSASMEQSGNSIIPLEFVDCTADTTADVVLKNEDLNSMEESIEISPNSPNAIDLVANTSLGITSDANKSPPPLIDNSTPKSSPKSAKKIKIWRPARVGDLREEHFETPRQAKRNFHILAAKCKQYKQQIALYRSKVWRLEKKVKTLENMFSQLTDKKLMSKETTSQISSVSENINN